MAKHVKPLQIGIDVSKSELWIQQTDGDSAVTLPNEYTAIRPWLRTLPRGSALALEATNTYHLVLAEEAYRLGLSVHLIDGLRLNRYRESVGGRAKTDRTDAQLLRRYLIKEGDELRAWEPPPKAYQQVQRLLRRRAKLVEARKTLLQSLQDIPGLKQPLQSLLLRIKRLEQLLEKRLREQLCEAEWDVPAKRCAAIEGIGPLTAAALTMSFHRGHFRSSDAFIAFLGLDVKVRDSGQQRGRRKLTKQGDPELRRLLHNAAMAAVRSPVWQPVYQRYLDRGLARTQALVAVARKLARIAFALLRSGEIYRPKMA